MHQVTASPIHTTSGLQLKPALFLHIQKTAGTSMVELAAHYYGNKNVSSHGSYVGQSASQFQRVPFVSGHFGYDFARPLMPGRYSFTFLRDPAKRILSFYHFCRNRQQGEFEVYDLARRLPVEDFLELGMPGAPLRSQLWNNQTWQLAHGYQGDGSIGLDTLAPEILLQRAIDHLSEFSHIGFVQTFAEDKDVIARALGFPGRVPTLRVNVSTGGSYRHVSRRARSLLRELTTLDQELIAYAWAQRNSQRNWFTKLSSRFRSM